MCNYRNHRNVTIMKKLTLIVFLIALPFGYASAQKTTDQLWKMVNDTKQADTNRLKALQLICVQGYLYTQPDSALQYAGRLYRMAKRFHSLKYQSAALNIQGAASSMRGDNTRAIAYFTRSLKIMEELNDRKGISSCLNNIGVIYDEQEKYEKAEEYYSRASAINEKTGTEAARALSYTNLGNVYRNLKDYPKSIDYHQRAITINKALKDDYSLGISLHSIGVTYFDMGDDEKALAFNEESVPYYEQSGNVEGLPEVLNILGKIWDHKGNTAKAIAYNRQALELSQKIGVAADIREAGLSLYTDYKKLGKYKDALNMYELYIVMRDKVKSEESQQELLRQELSHQFEKQQALDEKEHEKQLAVAGEREQRQKVLLFSIGIGSFLVLLFAVVVIKRLQITQRQKRVIEGQKELVEEKQKEILDSITYAKRLQDAILPSRSAVKEHFPESFIFYKPKDIVAGDFYWMEKVGDKTFVAVADCTGHGVPGAMVSVVCSSALNRAVLEFGITDPGKILDKARELVLETFAKSHKDVKDGMDISLLVMDPVTREIAWAGANNPLWYVADGELKSITADKQPIGSAIYPRPFTTHSLRLQKNDMVFLFTDGYADQFGGGKGKKFKYNQLKELLLNNAPLSVAAQEQLLETAFATWKKGLEQVDDVCVMGIRA